MTTMKNEWFMFIQIAFWSRKVFRAFIKCCTPGYVHVLAGRPRVGVTADVDPLVQICWWIHVPPLASRPFVPPYQGNNFLLQVDNFNRRRPVLRLTVRV